VSNFELKNFQSEDMKRFIEEYGIVFEQGGLTRMAGKIYGWLLICDPEKQTAADIAEMIDASIASVSTNLRNLLQFRMIEKTGVPGERASYYKISYNSWHTIMSNKLYLMEKMEKLAKQGLELITDKPEDIKKRLIISSYFYKYLNAEFKKILENFNKEYFVDGEFRVPGNKKPKGEK